MNNFKERLLSKDYGKTIRNLVIAMAFVAVVSVLFIVFFAIPELRTANTYYLETAIIYEPSRLVEVTSAILGLCAIILFTLYWIAFSIYLYKKAKDGDIIPILWLFLALYMNIFALFAFLIVRSIIREKCPDCKRYVKKSAIYCKYCGKELKIKCHECGEYTEIGAEYCPKCGNDLELR